MKHSELVATITKQIGKEPTQQEIANILGLTRNAISSRAFRDKEYSYSEVEKLENAFKINFSNQCFIDDMHNSSGTLFVDYYPDELVIKNDKKLILSNIKEKIYIPKICISDYFPLNSYVVTNAFGDGMQPTIHNADKLILELIRNDEIKDNHIYVFYYNDHIFCRRLVRNIDNIVVSSDNSDKTIYPTTFIQKHDISKIRILGKVVGLMRAC